MKSVHIWGIKFSLLSKAQIVRNVQSMLDRGYRHIHLAAVNPETVVQSRDSDRLRAAINDADIVNIDNMLVALTLRLHGIHVPERAATPDLFRLFLGNAEQHGQSVFFLGAKESVLAKMLEKVRELYPRLNVAGYQHGYFRNEADVLDKINETKPDYLFVALPTPQKETFIQDHKDELDVGVCYGVGGAFDVLAGAVRRLSFRLGSFEFEGIFRVLQKPWDYGRRVLRFYPRFIANAIRCRRRFTLEEAPVVGQRDYGEIMVFKFPNLYSEGNPTLAKMGRSGSGKVQIPKSGATRK